MQALPLIAAGALALGFRQATSLFAIGAIAYAVLTAALLYGALRVRPTAKR